MRPVIELVESKARSIRPTEIVRSDSKQWPFPPGLDGGLPEGEPTGAVLVTQVEGRREGRESGRRVAGADTYAGGGDLGGRQRAEPRDVFLHQVPVQPIPARGEGRLDGRRHGDVLIGSHLAWERGPRTFPGHDPVIVEVVPVIAELDRMTAAVRPCAQPRVLQAQANGGRPPARDRDRGGHVAEPGAQPVGLLARLQPQAEQTGAPVGKHGEAHEHRGGHDGREAQRPSARAAHHNQGDQREKRSRQSGAAGGQHDRLRQ